MIGSFDRKPAAGGLSEGARREVQLACFRIGAEMYALDIMRIKEIIRPLKLTSVPKAPPFIEGVINLRGAVIPVIDLRKRFDQPAESGRKTRIIICTVAGKILGLMVDEVTEVRRYSLQEIQPTPRFIKGRETEFFPGVCRRGEDLILLLDIEKILSSGEKIDMESIQRVHEADALA